MLCVLHTRIFRTLCYEPAKLTVAEKHVGGCRRFRAIASGDNARRNSPRGYSRRAGRRGTFR